MSSNFVTLTDVETTALYEHLTAAKMNSTVERLRLTQSFTGSDKQPVLDLLRGWLNDESTETFTPGLLDLREELMRDLLVPPYDS